MAWGHLTPEVKWPLERGSGTRSKNYCATLTFFGTPNVV